MKNIGVSGFFITLSSGEGGFYGARSMDAARSSRGIPHGGIETRGIVARMKQS
jgi:hypothetical protein